MKKNILVFALGGVMALTCFSATAQENEKASEARKEVAEATKDLKEAKTDSAADYQKFKKEAQLNIKGNQIRIAKLKTKETSGSKEIRAKYHKKVLILEQKNNQLENRLKKSDSTKTTMWGSFKRHFSHDMEELGEEFKDLSANNTK